MFMCHDEAGGLSSASIGTRLSCRSWLCFSLVRLKRLNWSDVVVGGCWAVYVDKAGDHDLHLSSQSTLCARDIRCSMPLSPVKTARVPRKDAEPER